MRRPNPVESTIRSRISASSSIVMDTNNSFLFKGTKFDRKRFAKDFDIFMLKKETDEATNKCEFVGGEQEKTTVPHKRRKHVEVATDGFNLFSNSKPGIEKEGKKKGEKCSALKKLNIQIEKNILARKRHNIHVLGNDVPPPLDDFADLKSRYKCRSYLLRNLAEFGFKEPTAIQRQTIPILLCGRDCFACSPTGSGKTFAFALPMLMKLKPRGPQEGVQAVIICPTRELAAQTTRECKRLAKGKKSHIKLMTKELAKHTDFSKLLCDVLISTPLRLQVAIKTRKLDLSRVEYLVLDEVDKLFDLGLVKQIDFIMKSCSNPSILRSMFSATLPDSVEELARTVMHDATRVIIGVKNRAAESVKQKLVFAGSEGGKLIAIRRMFNQGFNPPVLIFVQSKERAKQLLKELEFDNIRADAIHSGLSPSQRENAVGSFRAGKSWVLIATDVVGRGMDFKGVNCVVNYDFPDSAASYIHRIGRSGRAGREGEAVTLYTEEDIPIIRNVANVMAASGSEVPSWIMSIPKRKWRRHRPNREHILPDGIDQ